MVKKLIPHTQNAITVSGTNKAGKNEHIFASQKMVTELMSSAASSEADMEALELKLAVIEQKLASLKQTNPTAVTPAADANYNQPSADLVISGGETIKANTSINGASVTLSEVSTDSVTINITTDGEVVLDGYQSTGSIDGSKNHAQLNVMSNDHVTVKNCTFSQSGYNGIQFGVNGTKPKSITIENCVIDGNMTNNTFNVYGHEDGCVITLNNVHFKGAASNCLRFGNAENTKATINVINCKFDRWESDSPWQGCICLQDHIAKSVEEAAERNVFAPEKMKFNFTNCYGPGNKKIDFTGVDPKEWLSSGDANQFAYVYAFEFVDYDEARYPSFSFK